MMGSEIQLSKEEHRAMIQRAERAEERCKELREELFRWRRARNRWMVRAFTAERAIKKVIPLISPIAGTHTIIENRSYGGPPSPLMSVRAEAAKAFEAYVILNQAQEERNDRRTRQNTEAGNEELRDGSD